MSEAYYLVGPTAVGKSAVAQYLAEKRGVPVLSADSMLVYRGMDIGTAKPSRQERGDVPYYGIDLVEPGDAFSAWDYMETLRPFLSDLNGCIVAGGTGLYVQGLLCGLSEMPGADEPLRREWKERVEKEGVEPLQALLMSRYPESWDALEDRKNPRRLIRALELARAGCTADASWSKSYTPVPGLLMEREALLERIAARVDDMFRQGLESEVRKLLEKGGLSGTAAQAIGYSEVSSLLRGDCGRDEARESIVRRTARLAKRQMTWFRNQANVEWIAVSPGMEVMEIAGLVEEYWENNGPAALRL